jgi:hypothetical protein
MDIEHGNKTTSSSSTTTDQITNPDNNNTNNETNSLIPIPTTTNKHQNLPHPFLDSRNPITNPSLIFPYIKPKRRSPCSIIRCCSSIMLPAVLLLFGITYVPMISFYADYLSIMIPFHLLLGLSLKSYYEIVTTDPGTVPDEWHESVSKRKNQNTYHKCRKTQKFIPLRAVYDNISGRIVLCQDHFCPWVANCVGFYNRKFFILFCFWTCLLSAFCGILLGRIAWASLDGNNHFDDNSTPGGRGVIMMASVLDCTFFVCLIFFCMAHFYMAAKNQTSIEDVEDSKRFDRGWRENFKVVFGSNPKLWLLPVWGSGPFGDGVCWIGKDGLLVGLPTD